MSLVNDALKKARLEAARGDVANRNIPYPILGRGERDRGGIWIVALAAMVLLAVAGGLFLYRAGKQSALKEQVVEHVATAQAEPASAASPGNEASTSSQAPRPDVQPAPPQSASSEPSPAAPVSNSNAATLSPASDAGPRPSTAGESSRPPSSEPSTPSEPQPPPAATGSTRVTRPPQPDTQLGQASRIDTDPAETAPVHSERSALPPATELPTASDRQPAGTEPDVTATTLEANGPLPPTRVTETAATDAPPQEFLQRAEIPGVGAVELGGIAWSGDRPFALVNGRVVRPGDTVSGLVVDDIQPNTVRLRGDGGTLIFRLK